MLDPFQIHEPSSVLEASQLLAEYGDQAAVYAGGTELLVIMKERLVHYPHLVNIKTIPGLNQIAAAEDELIIGALATHKAIEQSPLVLAHAPLLAELEAQVANLRVRSTGTLGGNLCYADPATDPPGCLLALDARVRLASRRGTRELALADFIVDFYTTAIEPDELVQDILVPPLPAGAAGHYARHLRTAAEHRPMASAAVLVQRRGDICTAARIVVGAATPVPRRLARAEEALIGQRITAERVAEAASLAAAEITPIDDLRGSAEYRRTVVRVQAERCLAGLFGLPVR